MSVGWQVEWRVVDFTGHDSALATSGMQLADRKFCENLCVCLNLNQSLVSRNFARNLLVWNNICVHKMCVRLKRNLCFGQAGQR